MIKIKKSSFFFYQSAHLSAFCLQICHILAGLNSSLLPACRRLAQALNLQQTFAFVLLHTQQSCCIAYMQCSIHVHMYLILSKHAALQVSVDNIDADLFGRGVRGGSFQPSDDTLHAIKSQAITLLTEAYDKDMVRTTPCMLSTCKPLAVSPKAYNKDKIRAYAACGSVWSCSKGFC